MSAKAKILEQMIRDELKLMRSHPRYTRPMAHPIKSYVRLIHRIRISEWIKDLRAERGEL